MSRHVMGTVRMGNDPETSVADGCGRLYQFENVLIADSSVFVTSSGYGPDFDPGRPGRPGGDRHGGVSEGPAPNRRAARLLR